MDGSEAIRACEAAGCVPVAACVAPNVHVENIGLSGYRDWTLTSYSVLSVTLSLHARCIQNHKFVPVLSFVVVARGGDLLRVRVVKFLAYS